MNEALASCYINIKHSITSFFSSSRLEKHKLLLLVFTSVSVVESAPEACASLPCRELSVVIAFYRSWLLTHVRSTGVLHRKMPWEYLIIWPNSPPCSLGRIPKRPSRTFRELHLNFMNCLGFGRHYLSVAGWIYIGTYGISNVSLMAPHGEGFWNSISDGQHRRRYRTRNAVCGLFSPFIFSAEDRYGSPQDRGVFVTFRRLGGTTPAELSQVARHSAVELAVWFLAVSVKYIPWTLKSVLIPCRSPRYIW